MTLNLSLVCFSIINASRNALAIISLKNTYAKDVIPTAWSAQMEAPSAQSVIKELTFRVIHASNSAEWVLSFKMKLLSPVTNANLLALLVPSPLRYVILVCRS